MRTGSITPTPRAIFRGTAALQETLSRQPLDARQSVNAYFLRVPEHGPGADNRPVTWLAGRRPRTAWRCGSRSRDLRSRLARPEGEAKRPRAGDEREPRDPGQAADLDRDEDPDDEEQRAPRHPPAPGRVERRQHRTVGAQPRTRATAPRGTDARGRQLIQVDRGQ